MTDRETFIAAIAATPDDDTPRLAFADFLEENGDAARAGFIRDQVRLAKLRPGTEEYRELFRRTADTLRANLPAWIQSACDAFGQPAAWRPTLLRRRGLSITLTDFLDPLQMPMHGLLDATFERGLMDRAGVKVIPHDGEALSQLLREHPVTRLMLRCPYQYRWAWETVPELERIRTLTVDFMRDEDTATNLFMSKAWASVTRLTFGWSLPAAVAILCRSPFAKQLHGLRLPMQAEFLAALAAFPLDDRLQELSVYTSAPNGGSRPMLRENVARLSVVPFRPTLKKLSLASCTIGDAGLATFARGDVWIRLRALALDRNRFGDPGWRDFVRGRRTPELRMLSASRNFLTDDGAVRLGDSPLVETLEYVDLRGNRIEGKGALALARRLAGGRLKKLLLAGNPIKNIGALRNVLGDRVDLGG